MAEVFVPSTQGEGQGAAQIFQSNPQFADASGIVRGIERGEASLAKQREQQYEKQLEAQKKKYAQNKLLQDAQNKTNIKELDGAKDLIYQEYVNKAKSDPNFDFEGNFPTLIRDLESVNSLAEGVSELSKTLSSGSKKISSYIGGEYVDNTVPILQSVMNGTLYESDEERLKAIQDGTYTQDLNAKISQAFSDPNVIVNADKGVKDAYDGLIAKAQEQKTISESGTTLDGKPIIRETKKVTTNKQIKEALMNDPALKTIERNKYARENNISPLAVDEHLIENGYKDGFIGYYTELVNSQFPKDLEFTERVGSRQSGDGRTVKPIVSEKSTDKRKEGEGYVKSEIDEIGINVLKEGSATTEQPVTIDVDGSQKSGFIKAVTKDADGNIKVKVEYKEGGDVKSEIVNVDDVREYLSDAQIKEIQAKGADVNIGTAYDLDSWIDNVTSGFTANKDIAKDLVYFIPNATNITDPENSSDDIAFSIGDESYSLNLEDDDDLKTFKELVKSNSSKTPNENKEVKRPPLSSFAKPKK